MSYHYNFGNLDNRVGEMFADMAGGGIGAAVFGSILLAMLTFGLVFAAGVYVFKRLGLYRMVKNAGIPNAWLVFVPLADSYYMGQLTERSLYISTGKRQPVALVYLITGIALAGVSSFSFLGGLWLAGIVTALGNLFLAVLRFYCLYYIYHDYAPENDVLYTILGIIPLTAPILFLVYRNSVPVSVAGRVAGGQPKYTQRPRGQNPQGGQTAQASQEQQSGPEL